MIKKKICLIGISVLGILAILYSYRTSDSLLNPYSHFHILYIQSGSMEPTIMVGEAVVIQKQKSYEQGEIITYMVENQYLVTHRIQEKKEEGYITKGDHNNQIDEVFVRLEDIQGKVIFHASWLGILFRYRWWIGILFWMALICFFR